MQYWLIYEDLNGYCRIVKPEGKFWDHATDAEKAISHLRNIAIPDCVEFFACKPELVPEDLTFRDAWKKGTINDPIQYDFDKALNMHRARIQEACERKIAQLNHEYELALEAQNLPQQVAVLRTKKILRSLHDMSLTHCKTIEDIKYAIPKELHDVWTYYEPKRTVVNKPIGSP